MEVGVTNIFDTKITCLGAC